MDWFWLAVLSPALLSLTNIGDKFIISKSVKYPVAYTMLIGFFQILFSIFIISFFKVQFLYPASFAAIAGGIFWIIAVITYSKAMMIEEPTRVLSIFALTPILTTIFAAIFLKEFLSVFNYLGIFLLVASSILISQKRIQWRFNVSPALKYILLGLPFFALVSIMEKFGLNVLDFISFYFWFALGSGATSILFLASDKLRLDFGTQFFIIKNKKLLGPLFLLDCIALGSLLVGLYAVSQTYVSFVSALSNVQPFFILLFSLILSLIFPHIIKEEFNRRDIVIKLVAVLVIFAGGWLIVT